MGKSIRIKETDHVQGSLSAPIVLVEYADYQCPYCGQVYPVIKQLQKRFGDKMAFVFRNYPIPELHPYALNAAIASEAAGLQDKFWEMHDIIFNNQRYLEDQHLLQYAKAIDLDIQQFENDFSNQITLSKVEQDIESGNALGIRGTPAFFVNGKYFAGNWATDEFSEYLESVL